MRARGPGAPSLCPGSLAPAAKVLLIYSTRDLGRVSSFLHIPLFRSRPTETAVGCSWRALTTGVNMATFCSAQRSRTRSHQPIYSERRPRPRSVYLRTGSSIPSSIAQCVYHTYLPALSSHPSHRNTERLIIGVSPLLFDPQPPRTGRTAHLHPPTAIAVPGRLSHVGFLRTTLRTSRGLRRLRGCRALRHARSSGR